MIQSGEHHLTDKIVGVDVEYGGGRTVPRVSIVNFNEEVLYYSDFCLRYEDWIETKLTTRVGSGDDPAAELEPSIFLENKPKPDETKSKPKEGDDSEELSDEELQKELAEYKRKIEQPEFYDDFQNTSRPKIIPKDAKHSASESTDNDEGNEK